ncbi:MAG: hypothetical protein O9264_02415 [Leptospira sp.]|nr:hypothetical protein [Leptospira sp.]
MTETQYEFNSEHNTILSDLAKKMQFVGIFEIVLGGIYFLGSIAIFSIANIGTGVIDILLGYLTLKASKFFKAIVDSEGNDMTHLMNAIVELKNLYAIQFWLNIFLIVIISLGIVFGIYAVTQGQDLY